MDGKNKAINMNTKLHGLKQQEMEAASKLNTIRNQISRVESKELLPLYKKKYEGKYFKYRNCYSCPKDESEKWWMYVKVEKVTQLRWMQGFTFQTDMYGKVAIEQEKALSESSCQVAITKKEFDAAYKRMLKRIETIYGGRK